MKKGTADWERSNAKRLLKAAWGKHKRLSRMTKDQESRLLARNPNYRFRSVVAPGWAYLPKRDMVEKDSGGSY